MARFAIDRTNLPKPWESPLLFVMTDGQRRVTAEISSNAVLEYREAGRVAITLAFQRREDFLQAVEAAVGAIEKQDLDDAGRVTLGWRDLYP